MSNAVRRCASTSCPRADEDPVGGGLDGAMLRQVVGRHQRETDDRSPGAQERRLGAAAAALQRLRRRLLMTSGPPWK